MIVTPLMGIVFLSIFGLGAFFGLFMITWTQEAFASKIVRLLRDNNREDIIDCTKGIRNMLFDVGVKLEKSRLSELTTEEETEDLAELIEHAGLGRGWPCEIKISDDSSVEWKEFDELKEELKQKTDYLSQWIDAFYDLEADYKALQESSSKKDDYLEAEYKSLQELSARKDQQIVLLKNNLEDYKEESKYREEMEDIMESQSALFKNVIKVKNNEIDTLVKELADYREQEQEKKNIDVQGHLATLRYFSKENIPELSELAQVYLAVYEDTKCLDNAMVSFVEQVKNKEFQKKHGIVGWEKRVI